MKKTFWFVLGAVSLIVLLFIYRRRRTSPANDDNYAAAPPPGRCKNGTFTATNGFCPIGSGRYECSSLSNCTLYDSTNAVLSTGWGLQANDSGYYPPLSGPVDFQSGIFNTCGLQSDNASRTCTVECSPDCVSRYANGDVNQAYYTTLIPTSDGSQTLGPQVLFYSNPNGAG